jgi:hypothetical protein
MGGLSTLLLCEKTAGLLLRRLDTADSTVVPGIRNAAYSE